MSRIVLASLDFPPTIGGIQSYLLEIFSRLAREHSVHVVAPADPGVVSGVPGMAVSRPSTTWRRILPHRGLADLMGVILVTARLVFSSEVDLLVAGHPRLAPFLLILARLRRCPFVVLTYGMEMTSGRGRRLVQRALTRADQVVCISEFCRKLLEGFGVARDRLAKVSPGVDAGRFPTPRFRPGSAGGLRLLTVGRLDAREGYKGQDVVIEVLSRNDPALTDVTYRVVGDGSDRARLERLAAERGVEARVRFSGRVSDSQLIEAYSQADVFVMLSQELEDAEGLKFEGFGIVFLEAGAAGLACLGGRSGGIPDAVIDGETGILVDPTDRDAVQEALRTLAGDPDGVRSMGMAGRALATDRMSWDHVAEAMERVLAATPGR